MSAPGLTSRYWLHPVLATFMRALPFAYREVAAETGTAVSFVITGEAGGEWSLVREPAEWRLLAGAAGSPAAAVTLDQDTAWRMFTKGLDREQVAARVRITGQERWGAPFLGCLAIMA